MAIDLKKQAELAKAAMGYATASTNLSPSKLANPTVQSNLARAALTYAVNNPAPARSLSTATTTETPVYDPTAFDPLSSDNEFINNLRNALKDSYATGMANLNNQRFLDQSSIMNQANKAGVMFSNIPQRMKLQYDTNTYMPNQVKIRQSYQSGLDSLRENAINAANQVAYYQQMINHYNTMPTSSGSGSSSAQDIANAVQDALAGV